MPGLYKDEGVVLKTIKLGEADRIVTLYTRDNGKVRAVAKGVRKTKSRFGARLEPFTHVSLLIYRGRSLDTITGADILTSFDEVRCDYEKLMWAAAVAESVDKVSEEREQSFGVYSLLLAALAALAGDKGGSVVPAFLIKLLSLSGFHPSLSVCAGCSAGGPLEGFSVELGGAVCATCWREDPGAVRLAADRLALLSDLLTSEFGRPATIEQLVELTTVLRRYAEWHLERPLRSLHL